MHARRSLCFACMPQRGEMNDTKAFIPLPEQEQLSFLLAPATAPLYAGHTLHCIPIWIFVKSRSHNTFQSFLMIVMIPVHG